MSDETTNFNEEEELEKVYDSKLMKRLILYARPYWKYFFLAIMLLFAATLMDLARPYLMKVAIDDYINGYSKPMVTFPLNSGEKGIIFEGQIFKRVPLNYVDTHKTFYTIVYLNKTPYLVQGRLNTSEETKGVITAISKPTGKFNLSYSSNGRSYKARLLTLIQIKTFRSGDVSAMRLIGIIFLFTILLGFIFNYIEIFILSFTGQTIIYNIRQQVFTHIQRLSLGFFDKNPIGRLVTRITNDTEALNEMYTNVLVSLLKDFSILAGTIIIMLSLGFGLTLVTLAAIPFILGATLAFRLVSRKVYRRIRVTLARINSTLSENISGMQIIQMFSREKEKNKEFKHINDDYKKAQVSEVIISGVFRPVIEMFSSLVLAAIIWYGGGNVIEGTLKFGVLYAFVNYITFFFQPINDLAEKYNILQSAMASSERIFQVLDTPTEPDSGILSEDNGIFKQDIEFKNVWFAYNGEDWVLRDVSFKVPAGSTVAIVGATGAGKTSIINLINRLYEIQKGEIIIGNRNISTLKKETLRKGIGAVLQDVFLFSGSIKDNIRLNEENIDDEAIMRVSDYVNASGFIKGLPSGFDEEVMERGSTFSSGQRQLLAFARTLAFDPSILILDEATANIDTETELLIQDALTKLTKGRTTIVIAHRLSTIQHADNIIVLHKGKIREMGSHQDLLAKKGMYFNLYELQYKTDS